MFENLNKNTAEKMITKKLTDVLFVSPEAASDEQFYKATAMVIKDLLTEKHKAFVSDANSKGKKKVHYLSMEFLVGRSLKNNVYNLNLLEPFAEALSDMGVKITNLYECEPDAGLGNGGLGRLAACYLDALATLEIPATGYSILYEYGIFKQKIEDGWQTELPDYWLPGGEVWLTPRVDQSIEVHFGGQIEEFWDQNYHHLSHKDYSTVIAVPYDMYISGYGSKGVSVLRLWQAKSPGINMDSFNKGDYVGAFGQNSLGEVISKILYPNDSHNEGKALRLRQQYFLAAASMGDIVKRHFALYGQFENFAEKNAIHINDTHPTLAIPELMRIFLDECGYDWDKSWDIVSKAFAYTNHTVLSEALEKWNIDLFKAQLPRIHQITCEINRRFCAKLYDRYHLDNDTVSRMAILGGSHEVRMANLCIASSHSVNGVSQLHSDIIKNDLFRDFSNVAPFKFKNVTNGIASRRWLYQSNPLLTNLLKETIGDGFLKDMSQLERFKKYEHDSQVLKQLADIKHQNKERFCKHVSEKSGVILDPNSIFDVQVKRLHEYKRQHLNALNILTEYLYLKENPNADFTPKTYIFGAKAAPGYYFAKQIIKMICTLSKVIENDPAVRDKLRIYYVEDYNVTLSELLMPASEISEQISLAGKEASGTGNMKLMLNGAITLGTLDGANVEISQAVGFNNAFIFGMTADEAEAAINGYNPDSYYQNNSKIRSAIDTLTQGLGGETFTDIANSLRFKDSYMVMADFESYCDIQRKASETYRNNEKWQSMSLMNIASSGIFCADRAISDYARTIWGIKL